MSTLPKTYLTLQQVVHGLGRIGLKPGMNDHDKQILAAAIAYMLHTDKELALEAVKKPADLLNN